MGKSWLGAALTAGMLALAGCSGFVPAGGTPTETVTPAPVPSPPPATRTPETTGPPGVANGLVTNPGALWRAHQEALTNASYAVQFEETIRYANGSISSTVARTTRVSRDGLRSRGVVRARGNVRLPLFTDATRVEFYLEGDEGYARAGNARGDSQEDDGREPRYARFDRSFESRFRVSSSSLFYLFGSMELRVDGIRRGNVTVFRIVSTDLVAPGFLAEALDVDGDASIENASLRAMVAPSGLVRAYRLNYTLESGRTVLRGTRSVQYGGIGSTGVRRPPWYREAVDATPVRPGSGTPEGPAIETFTPTATPSRNATGG